MQQSLVPHAFYRYTSPRRLIDIRPAGAYAKGTLRDAVSYPYDHKDSLEEFAKKIMLGFTGAHLHIFDVDGRVAQELAGLLSCTFLHGGYKGFQRWREEIFSSFQFIVIGGCTGSGKTDLLQKMAQWGFQVLNFEELAQHRGSVFGFMNEAQPRHEEFHNKLLSHCMAMDEHRPVWIEEKGDYLGHVGIPQAIKDRMLYAPYVMLSVPFAERLQRIMERYNNLPAGQFRQAIRQLEKRMGTSRNHKALHYYDSGQQERCFELLLNYYDEAYETRRSKAEPVLQFEVLSSDCTVDQFKKVEEHCLVR